MAADLITREILWNIPYSFKVIMYVLAAAALLSFFGGGYLRLKSVMGGTIYLPRDNVGKRLKNLICVWLFQSKLGKNPGRWFVHALMFWGFVTLFIVTEIVAVEEWTPGNAFFHGNFYIVVSFFAEIAGIALLLGSGLSLLRRLTKPNFLTQSADWYLIHFFLITFCLMGFFIEGLRVSQNLHYWETVAIAEAGLHERYALIGYLLGQLMYGMSEGTAVFLHRWVWLVHMICTMIFIGMIPFTRLWHIFVSAFNIYGSRDYAMGKQSKMDFENIADDVEYFGTKYSTEFTVKQRLDFDSCLECGLCEIACPAYAAGANLNPKNVIQSLALALKKEKTAEGGEVNVHELVSTEALWACTTCGACVEQCPVEINQLESILEMRRFQVMGEAALPKSSAGDAIKNIEKKWKPLGNF